MLKLQAKTIPLKKQRYSTLGDYYKGKDKLEFRITELGNPYFEALILIHEIVEFFLTQKRGISEDSITKFDIESKLDDPGLSPEAPYHSEHMFANCIEKQVCEELGFDWEEYNLLVDDKFYNLKNKFVK